MSTSKPRSINGLFLLVAVLGLVFGSAGPASAAHYVLNGGATDSPGEEWGPPLDQLCSDNNNQFTGAQFESTYYLITEEAFTFVVYASGTYHSVYQGPLSMRIDHGDAVFGPQGAAPGECTGFVITPAPVPLTEAKAAGAATGPSGAGYVDCRHHAPSGSPGTYNRVTDNVTFYVDLSCTVKGNNGYTASPYVWTTFTINGTQNTSGYLRLNSTQIAVSAPGH